MKTWTAVALAAPRRDTRAMSTAFQQLTATCMDCHIDYLERYP
jgi:hypothetical protein